MDDRLRDSSAETTREMRPVQAVFAARAYGNSRQRQSERVLAGVEELAQESGSFQQVSGAWRLEH